MDSLSSFSFGVPPMNEAVFTLQRLALELIAAKRPANEILDSLCTLVQEIVPNGLATVMRFDPKNNTLTFCNAPSAPGCVLEAFGVLTPGPFAGSCGASVYERKMVAVEDTATDPRWESLRSVAQQYEIRSCWSVPIFIGKTEIAGTFAISRSVIGTPSDDERQLLELAAYLAGFVIQLENAETHARAQDTLLRAIVNCAEDPIFVKDMEGRYQVVNEAEARHRGLTMEDVIGKTDAELNGAYDVGAVEVADQQVIAEQKSVMHEVEVTCVHDGEVRDYLVRKDPLRDDEGNVCGIVGMSRDVTERRRVERAMQQAQKLESLGVLAGGIAHDFNNLLVGVMANASMLAEDDRIADPDLLKSVLDIRLASVRAADLTRQLLQYAGKREPARETFALGSLLGEVPDLLATGISKKVQLRTQLDVGLPPVDADPVQIRQVLMNLILNASESFDGNEGAIDVRASLHRNEIPTGRSMSPGDQRRGDWIQVTVTDNGCGMDADTVAKIFDPFYTTKTTGRGLGLAAVLGIIGSHGGCMDVESRVGDGTSFRIWLPVDCSGKEKDVVVIPGPSTTARGKASVGSRTGRILIVEDESTIGNVLRRILTGNGYEAVLAGDGQHGLEVFNTAGNNGFDMVILDLTMPGLDGHELAQRIREHDDEIPIVLTSGLGEVDARVDCGAQLVDSFLCKPFDQDQVLQAMDDATKNRQLLRV
ncbi:MAG: two-component system cell cycle sensor histidine kinase/response regulator CckA [Planctomycetota bacterium]|jgi:two-component system cell cycle sensor histidine kinase/response regulator CckA